MQTVRQATLIASVILPVLAVITVCLRFYARKARKLPLLADDWSILLALICTIFASILTFYGDIARGLGLGPAEINGEQATQAYKVFYAIMLLVYLTFGIVKISALLFYKRIFTEPRFNLAANIMMAAVVSWTIVQFIIQSLNSWNTPGFWKFKLLDYGAFNISMAVLDFVFDILILLLPLPVISKLQMGKKQKYSIIGIFWLGAICVIASALRIFYTHAFLSITTTSSESWITYITSSNSLWLIVEANVSIIAACLPTLGGFLKGRLTAKSTNAGTKYTGGSVRMLSQKGAGRGRVLISEERRNTWVPLRNMNVETRAVNETGEEKAGCPERARGIMVETTFASESRAWA